MALLMLAHLPCMVIPLYTANGKREKMQQAGSADFKNVPLKVSIMTRGIIISACLAMGNFSPDIDPAAVS